MRAIVNVATGRFVALQDRLRAAVERGDCGADLICWRDEYPPGSPTHEEAPFAFKAFAVQAAMNQGPQSVLWLDSAVMPVKPLAPLWDLIERQGYWFSSNPPYNDPSGPKWNCGQWTCDSALGPLDAKREELFAIPHVIGGAFGLNFRHEIAWDFFREYLRLATERTAFQGPIANENGEASADPRVLGHRH